MGPVKTFLNLQMSILTSLPLVLSISNNTE